jgi:outer membrane protein TolC
VYRDQGKLLEQMSVSARARLEVGRAGLADVGQIDLRASRMADMLSGVEEMRRQASAGLVAALGAPPGTATPVRDDPPALLEPIETQSALADALASHPEIESLRLMARSRSEAADAEEADGYPSFMLGLTVIETGEALAPNTPDSGKDPVILSLAMSLPLWRGAYDGKQDAARADSSALVAKRQSALDEARAELTQTLSSLRDARRRVKLYRHTLVPQADTVLGSVLGQYQSGEGGGVASAILAQKELLELELALYRAQADHAVAWAHLEEVVGRALKAREVKP